jgi:hypothetical protein
MHIETLLANEDFKNNSKCFYKKKYLIDLEENLRI